MTCLMQPGPGDVVDAQHAVHVAGRDRVHRGEVARAAGLREPLADAGEDGVGAAEAGGRADRHHRSVPDQASGLDGGQYGNFSH